MSNDEDEIVEPTVIDPIEEPAPPELPDHSALEAEMEALRAAEKASAAEQDAALAAVKAACDAERAALKSTEE